MNFEVRVILVGRTGLDAKLRLDPTIELVRVKSPLEAIGELSDPIEGYSPSRAIVMVGVDIYSDEPAAQSGSESSADFTLRGTAVIDFARALRLVDPNVRILRVVMPSVMGARSSSLGATAQVGPSEARVSTIYYDEVINADLPADALRQIVHRTARGVEAPAEPAMPEPVSQSSSPAVSPASPSALSTEALPEPTLDAAFTLAAAEVLPRGGSAERGLEIGDAELVRLSLRGGDLRASALRIIRARLDDPGATISEKSESVGAAGGSGARVECDGAVFGYLLSSRADGPTLEAHAGWLGAWLRLAEQQVQLREAAFTDPLTGAWNRRYFDKFLSAAIERARTGRQSVTLMLFDIDNFKQYNDRFGHAAADEVLVETVRLLRSTIRPSDRVCRIGGDEFAVIFHEPAGPRVAGSTPPSSVFSITKRFQEQIKNQRFPKLGIEAPGTLTISGGLATFPWDGTSVGDLLRRADELAMESKRSGKNAIMFGPGAARGETAE